MREDAAAVADSVKLQQQQIEAGYRPNVFPITPWEWTQNAGRYGGARNVLLPLKNSGPGVALNVNAELYWRSPDSPQSIQTEIATGTIAPADESDARLTRGISNWEDVRGFVSYRDLMGQEWRTHFVFRQMEGQISVEIGAIVAGARKFDEPAYPPPEWNGPSGEPNA